MAMHNIVVTIAGSATSVVTAKYAIFLAKVLQARLTAIYVINERILEELLRSRVVVGPEALEYEREMEEQSKCFLERIKQMAESKGVEFYGMLLRGVVHEEVVNKTKEIRADLLVMGELKEASSRKEVCYDEGERIFREAQCPTVIVKNPEEVERQYREI